jgi:AraC-like DNA-binding protein
MTEMPGVLIQTAPGPATDMLSDLLESMHVTGMVLFRAEFREPWSVTSVDSGQLAAMLSLGSSRVIPFHIIGSGGCRIDLPDREQPLWLNGGDAVMLPYGGLHRLSGRDATAPVHIGQLLPQLPWAGMPVVEHGGGGDSTSVICGFIRCDELLFHPVLRHLPDVLYISPEATPADHWLATTIRHTVTEASQPQPGWRSMLPRLTELMFVEILRKHMQGLSADEVGWFAAYNDGVVGPALRLLHAAPLEDWSLESLARGVGVSRTVLSERFRHFLDQPPMQYLGHWRLQLAAKHLKSSELPIKTIADHARYESEAAFSRAFKRRFGLPPGDWRRRQALR